MKPDCLSAPAVTHGVVAGTGYSLYARADGAAAAREMRDVSDVSDASAARTETVVLIHGVGMNRSVWAPQIDALSARYQVLAYDMRGHGDSALPSATPTLAEYAAQLAHLLDALDIDAVHVVGHSMGSLVALEFALAYPARALSVAALNAVYRRSPAQREAVQSRAATLDSERSEASVDATLSRWFGDPVPASLAGAARFVRTLLLAVNPLGYARTYRLFACSDDAHVGRLGALAVPALFLTGEGDPNSSPEMSRAMAAQAPLGRAEIVPDERHMMAVTHPDAVNARLLDFLAQARRRCAAPARP